MCKKWWLKKDKVSPISHLLFYFLRTKLFIFFQAGQIIKMEFDSDWITFIIASLAVFIIVCIAVILRKTCSKYFCSGCDKHQNDEELGMWWRGPGPSLNKQLNFERNIFLTSSLPFDPLDWCLTQWEQLPLTCTRGLKPQPYIPQPQCQLLRLKYQNPP